MYDLDITNRSLSGDSRVSWEIHMNGFPGLSMGGDFYESRNTANKL